MITTVPKFDFRQKVSFDSPSVELPYAVFGTEDEAAVRAAVDAGAPETYGGLFRQEYSLEHKGAGFWEVSVQYGKKPPGNDTYTVQIQTTGGTEKRYQSIRTLRFGPGGDPAPDFQGAIGVKDRSVEGVDVTVPVWKMTLVRKYSAGELPPGYIIQMFHLTGKVNAEVWAWSWQGQEAVFQPGECLFMGIHPQAQGVDAWEISYEFAASASVEDLTIGAISNVEKRGWDYLWVLYEDQTSASTLVRQPKAVYVEEVYPDGDFSQIRL